MADYFIEVIRQDDSGAEKKFRVTYPYDGAPVGGVQTVYSASVTLTDAQIKALPTTSVEIIPAPGVGLAILFISGVVTSNKIAHYTNINADAAQLFLSGSGTTGFVSNDVAISLESLTGLLGVLQTDTETVSLPLVPSTFNSPNVGSYATWDSSPVENFHTVISIENQGDGNLTGGHANNTLKVTVLYTIISI